MHVTPYFLRGARRGLYSSPNVPMQGVTATDGVSKDQTAVAATEHSTADRKLPTTEHPHDRAAALLATTKGEGTPAERAEQHSAPLGMKRTERHDRQRASFVEQHACARTGPDGAAANWRNPAMNLR